MAGGSTRTDNPKRYPDMMTTSIVPALPRSSSDLISARGNVLGKRYCFGSYSAVELKTVIKSERGLRGRALTRAVREALTSEAAQKRVVFGAAVAELHNRGYMPDFMDVKEKGAVVKFVRPPEVKESRKDAEAVTKGRAEAEAKAKAAEDKSQKLMDLLAKLGGLDKAAIEAALVA